jgi:hypothetical protein
VDLTTPIYFEEENINKILVDSLAGNEIPIDLKEKINLFKKFITHYKKIKDDKINSDQFLEKISSVFLISLNDSKLILDYEMNKLKREGLFSNFSKVLNKFIIHLTDNNSRDLDEKFFSSENSELKQKLLYVISKGVSYIETIYHVLYFIF